MDIFVGIFFALAFAANYQGSEGATCLLKPDDDDLDLSDHAVDFSDLIGKPTFEKVDKNSDDYLTKTEFQVCRDTRTQQITERRDQGRKKTEELWKQRATTFEALFKYQRVATLNEKDYEKFRNTYPVGQRDRVLEFALADEDCDGVVTKDEAKNSIISECERKNMEAVDKAHQVALRMGVMDDNQINGFFRIYDSQLDEKISQEEYQPFFKGEDALALDKPVIKKALEANFEVVNALKTSEFKEFSLANEDKHGGIDQQEFLEPVQQQLETRQTRLTENGERQKQVSRRLFDHLADANGKMTTQDFVEFKTYFESHHDFSSVQVVDEKVSWDATMVRAVWGPITAYLDRVDATIVEINCGSTFKMFDTDCSGEIEEEEYRVFKAKETHFIRVVDSTGQGIQEVTEEEVDSARLEYKVTFVPGDPPKKEEFDRDSNDEVTVGEVEETTAASLQTSVDNAKASVDSSKASVEAEACKAFRQDSNDDYVLTDETVTDFTARFSGKLVIAAEQGGSTIKWADAKKVVVDDAAEKHKGVLDNQRDSHKQCFLKSAVGSLGSSDQKLDATLLDGLLKSWQSKMTTCSSEVASGEWGEESKECTPGDEDCDDDDVVVPT